MVLIYVKLTSADGTLLDMCSSGLFEAKMMGVRSGGPLLVFT